jgi:hypothetical protein
MNLRQPLTRYAARGRKPLHIVPSDGPDTLGTPDARTAFLFVFDCCQSLSVSAAACWCGESIHNQRGSPWRTTP